MSSPKIIFGAGTLDAAYGFDVEKTARFLDAIADAGIESLDTALIYGNSEELLGGAHAASRFKIDTKFPGGFAPDATATKEDVIQYGEGSLKKLQTKSVDVYYQHWPNANTPLEDTLAGVDALYKAGAFKRFGISNFTAEQVDQAVSIAKERGYVLPTVYQGSYNAFSRHIETTLFPTLRRHGIIFYAYSPSAGGFLAKTPDVLRANAGTGRWDSTTQIGHMYTTLYSKPALLDGLESWHAIAKGEGITGIELAYRWVAHHSKLDGSLGDGLIVGSRNEEQLKETVGWIRKGPLSADVVKKIDELWEKIKDVAPVNNFDAFK